MEGILILMGVVAGIAALMWFAYMVEILYGNRKKINAVMDHLGLELGDSYRLEYIDREDE